MGGVMMRCAANALLGLFALCVVPAAGADDTSMKGRTSVASISVPAMPAGFARRVQAITDAVLEHHVDPPVRQQMVLSGIKSLYRAAGVAEPLGLGRKVSAITTVEQLDGLLRDVWPRAASRPLRAQTLEEALFEGLLADVSGGAEVMTAREARVAEQMAGNRYVGLQIALRMDEKAGPVMAEIFPGGPAGRAGIAADTVIEAIDGTSTRGLSLREVVDRLRGDEGTEVTLLLRGPKDAASRTIRLRREALARTTITGIRENKPGDWQLRLDGPEPIGYLRITELTGSTPHELRRLAGRMESLGLRALVLDLRYLSQDRGESAHSAVLLADSLLERGTIGRIRTAKGVTTYQADADALFRGWPIAVLVDTVTSGSAEWLAAVLQDNHRAVVVGRPTRGGGKATRSDSASLGRILRRGVPNAAPRQADSRTAVEAAMRTIVLVGDGPMALSMVTGILESGGGRGPGAGTANAPSSGRGVLPDRPLPASAGQLLSSTGPSGRRLTRDEMKARSIEFNTLFINEAVAVLRKALQTP